MTADSLPQSPHPESSVKFFLIVAAAIAVVLVAIDDWHLLFAPGQNQPLGRDFLIFWWASVDIWNGELMTVFDPRQFSRALHAHLGGPLTFTPFPYPPLSVWFIAPLAALPYGVAWPAWLITTFGAFAATLRRYFATRTQCLLVLLAAPASLVNIAIGQNGFLSAALLCGGLMALERRPIVAGALIGLLTFKPQLGLLLPFVLLAGGYYRVFAVAAVTTLILFAGSVAWLGWEPWSIFFNIGAPIQRLALETGTGPIMVMVPSVVMSARMLDLPLWSGYAAQAVVGVAALVACCWTIRQKASLERRIAVVMAGTLVASPYCFNYDLTVLVAAQVLSWPGYRALGSGDRLVSALAWLVPVLMVVAGNAEVPIGPVILIAEFVVLLRWVALPLNLTVTADARSAVA